VLNFNHLYYFHITAAEGSVTGAAERLGVTQPTVSEQIRMLERALGGSLFERGPTGLRLTDRGREAFDHTTTMFLAGERLASALGQGASETPITFRIGVSAAVSRTTAAGLLMPVLALEQCFPSVRTGNFTDLLRELRSHEIDLLLCETEPLEAARPHIELAVVHRPTLVAVAHPEVEPRADWGNLSLLEYRAGSAYQWEVESFLSENGLCPKTVGELDDAFLMLEAAARGGLVAFVPSSVARTALQLGRVKPLSSLKPASAGVFALYHNGGPSDLARVAVERLIANARELFERDE
jgi:LysR family transcriptional activator of nhaA